MLSSKSARDVKIQGGTGRQCTAPVPLEGRPGEAPLPLPSYPPLPRPRVWAVARAGVRFLSIPPPTLFSRVPASGRLPGPGFAPSLFRLPSAPSPPLWF